MNTGVAQLIALAAHGNLALHRAERSASPLDRSTLFQYVEHLQFVLSGAETSPAIHTPSAWFDTMRSRGIVRLWLVRASESQDGPLKGYDRTGFVNNEQLVIAAVDADGAMELWTPQWHGVTHGGENRWVLFYSGFPMGQWASGWAGHSLPSARDSLKQTLQEIATFAAAQDLASWVPTFDGARELLEEDPPDDHFDLLPDRGYSREARQLLAAALSGWVFGGMGSWNDTGPADSAQVPRYESLTQQLFDAIMESIVTSTNAFEAAYL